MKAQKFVRRERAPRVYRRAAQRPPRLVDSASAQSVMARYARVVPWEDHDADDALAERLGQPVVVENRPGASGALAANAVKNLPFNSVHDFVPITQYSRAVTFVTIPASPRSPRTTS